MQKLKRTRLVLVAVVMFSMVAMYGFMPVAHAASLTSAKDTVSDSGLGATGVTHTVEFQSGVDLTVGTVVTLAFNASFLGTASSTCPSNATEGGTMPTLTCTVVSTLASTTEYTWVIEDLENPGTSAAWDVTISHNQAGNAESSEMLVYVIEEVTVSAHVDASLTFGLGVVAADTAINGTATTTIGGTATTIPFGDLTVDKWEFIGQELTVETNADGGFTVTVQQDGDLENGAGATINAFDDGTGGGIGSVKPWESPTGTIGAGENSYGHMGLTSADTTLSTAAFGANNYAGLDGVNTFEVMYHDGPADGSTAGAGVTQVGYRIEISSLQEAGDYDSTLTYICTPIF